MRMENQNEGISIPVFTLSGRVTRNQPSSKSLRMQIPASMKAFLGIDAGSVLEITLIIENGKHVAKIVKKEDGM